MAQLVKLKYTEDQVYKNRNEILHRILCESENINDVAFKAISAEDLRLMFSLYDKIFFNNWFKNNYLGSMKFTLSKRMSKSAGFTICPKKIPLEQPEQLTIEIRIGVNIFIRYSSLNTQSKVCGITTHNSLEALLLVFEHELCHVIEFLNYYKSNCKGERFKIIASRLFGHTDSCHQLPVIRKLNTNNKYNFKIRDMVSFEYRSKAYTGIICNITKRATVMVKDFAGNYKDREGNIYSKYYIPLEKLRKVKCNGT